MDLNAIERAWHAGRLQFPDVELPLEAFRALIQRPTASPDLASEDIAHAADLYLACACHSGNSTAQARLHALLRPLVESILARFGRRAPEVDDIQALLMERLLVARGEAAPRISLYNGAHPLGAWARVIALRLTLDKLPRAFREQPIEDAILENLHAVEGNPELLVLQARDGALVRLVVEAACRALDRRSRRVLRHALVERLTVDEIGLLYQLHRSSAARAVRRAMETLVGNARAELERLGGPNRADLPQLDLSLERWLRSTLHSA